MGFSFFIENIKTFNQKIESAYVSPFLDGALNPEEYYNSPIKIMWLMKEPYGEEFSYPKFYSTEFDKFFDKIITGQPWRTWKPVQYITYSILNNFIDGDELFSIPFDKNMARCLSKIAWVNIQKSASVTGTNTKMPNIATSWQKNSDLLIEQIQLLNPDIVICGNTFSIISESFGNPPEIKYPEDQFVPHYLIDDRLFLDPYHPSYSNRGRIDPEWYINDIIKTVKKYQGNFQKKA